MMYTVEQKVKLCNLYILTQSVKQTQRDFCKSEGLHLRKAPNKITIHRIVNKFRKEGSVHNQKHGRKVHKRTPENVQKVSDSVQRSPKKSCRKRCQNVKLSCTTTWRIMRENLKLYPYVIPIHHQLSEEHKKAKLEMCRKFVVKMDENGRWINDVWFSDEANFYLNGTVSTKNSRFWGIPPPPELHQQPLHSRKCTAWCALSARGIIGPFWFEDEEWCPSHR